MLSCTQGFHDDHAYVYTTVSATNESVTCILPPRDVPWVSKGSCCDFQDILSSKWHANVPVRASINVVSSVLQLLDAEGNLYGEEYNCLQAPLTRIQYV